MNSTVARDGTAVHAGHAVRSGMRFAVDAIRSVSWREFAYFSLIFLAEIGLYLAWMVEDMLKGGDKGDLIATNIVLLILVLPVMVASWAVADRSTGALPRSGNCQCKRSERSSRARGDSTPRCRVASAITSGSTSSLK